MTDIRYSSNGVSPTLITAGEPRLRRHRDLRIPELAVRLAGVVGRARPKAARELTAR